MFMGTEQLSKWWQIVGATFLTVREYEVTDKEGEEAGIVHVVMG